VDTRIQQQVQHWQRVKQESDMNPFILDSVAEPVNPLLGALDESFESNASIKLHGCPRELANFSLFWRSQLVVSS
jgi:hypothetical protein